MWPRPEARVGRKNPEHPGIRIVLLIQWSRRGRLGERRKLMAEDVVRSQRQQRNARDIAFSGARQRLQRIGENLEARVHHRIDQLD